MVLSTSVSMTPLRSVVSTCSRRLVDSGTADRFCTALTPILRLIPCSFQLPSKTKKNCTSCHLISACYRMLEDICPCWHRNLHSSTTSYATSIKSNDKCTMISKPLETCPANTSRTLRRVYKSRQITTGCKLRIISSSLGIAILKSKNG